MLTVTTIPAQQRPNLADAWISFQEVTGLVCFIWHATGRWHVHLGDPRGSESRSELDISTESARLRFEQVQADVAYNILQWSHDQH